MVAWLKALLFVAGGVSAAGGVAYVTGILDPWLGRSPAVIAALPENPAPPQAQPPAASEQVPLPEDPATTDKQARLSAPGFDLVRVEPDGSVLVAGKAPAQANVELLSGDAVLTSSTANASGDFVIVLDERLPAGDYMLSLRATVGDDVMLSTETAIVSVPEAEDGQVLVMVEEPGAPAELVTVPDAPDIAGEPAAPSESEQEVAAAAPAPETGGGEVASEPEATEVAGEPAAPADEEVAAAAAPAQEDEAEQEIAAASEPAPEVAEEEVAAASGSEAAPAGDEQVAAAPQEAVDEPTRQPAAAGRVVIEAVEIEGDTVFVAGQADPGRTVRVYANELLLGDARASEGGRFLVEARRELPVGDYVIRADLLSEDGTVLARAAVPFDREPGESIAAVAVPQEDPAAAEEQAAAAPEPEAAPEAVEEEVAAAPEPEAAPDAVEEEVAAAPEPEAAPEAIEEEVTAAPAPEAAPDAIEEEVAAAPEPEAAPEAVEEEAAIAAAPPAAEEDAVELTAPPLQRAGSSVIIRRGDNLWRISRRVYGKGVRYSTIYLANRDQISDPNRIWPGQVFAVPQETDEGELADMDAVAGQVAGPEQNGAAAQ